MMKMVISFLVLGLVPVSYNLTAGVHTKPIKIAVIDTGLTSQYNYVMCDGEHIDYTGTGLEDTINHGTYVAGIIWNTTKDIERCLYIYKYYSRAASPARTIRATIEAFKEAMRVGVDVINYSSYGKIFYPEEIDVIRQALDRGIEVVVASSNYTLDLDKSCEIFPACYDKRIVVVGRSDVKDGWGYGSIVDRIEDGNPGEFFGIVAQGTSMSTAIASGKIANDLYKRRKK